ncbi:MAG: zinc ribbon domain-containing protein [Anaerolineaceae bacterium]|nr:zinc ribbon domain-containing protein [Anaerolineaceae bacterium]
MTEYIEFTSNHSDLSTNNGFQFEFRCNHCQSGYRTQIVPYALGSVTNFLEVGNSLIGGLFGQAANLGERARDANYQKARDEAFSKAAAEIKPKFVQCPRCQTWVCRERCWNNKRGLCKGCAPDLGVELSAAQASRSVEEVWAHAVMAEEDKKLTANDFRDTIRATCPACNVPLEGNVKFCPECGAKIQSENKCGKCGAKMQPGTKFCSECGAKM